MENRNYRGINKTRTVIASPQKSVNIEQRVIALKSYKECQEESQISSSSSSSSSPASSSQKPKVQHQRPDSTVVDTDFESDKRKIFSCEYEGCKKKYTKLSHLKVRQDFLKGKGFFLSHGRGEGKPFYYNISYAIDFVESTNKTELFTK